MNRTAVTPRHRLARNTVLTTGWQGIRVALQAVWVILLARALGPSDYGSFAGMAGLAAALGSLTGLGFGMLMVQDASRNHEQFADAWKRAIYLALMSGLALWAIYIAVGPIVFGSRTSWWVYAAVGLPELVCFPVTIVAAYAFQLHERMGWAGALFTLIAVGNLIAVGFFLWIAPTHTLALYLPFHAVGSIAASVCAVVVVIRLLAPARATFSISKRDMREGMGFSLMRIADTGMTSLDKTLVLLLAGSEAAGIYGSAYRLVAVLAMPATSLGMAALPRLFRNHRADPNAQSRLIKILLVATIVYGLIAIGLAYLLSGVLPVLFGAAFAKSAEVARWLAISPLLYGLYALGCNVLVTSDRRTLRVLAQAAGIAILAVMALIWIPRYGLKGAVGMWLFTLVVTSAILWAIVRWNHRSTARPRGEAL
ncbi:MAG: lipopolysaccharide biosynthesis protein [Rhodanobacteraceae bacterium]